MGKPTTQYKGITAPMRSGANNGRQNVAPTSPRKKRQRARHIQDSQMFPGSQKSQTQQTKPKPPSNVADAVNVYELLERVGVALISII